MSPDIRKRMEHVLKEELNDFFESLSYRAAYLSRGSRVTDEEVRLLLAELLGENMADRWKAWTEEP